MKVNRDYAPAWPGELYRAATVRELDRRAIEVHGIAGAELMARAGAAAHKRLRQIWPAARQLAVLCGQGNNGGDGFVIARLAHEQGLGVSLMLRGEPARLQGDARVAWEQALAAGVEPVPFAAARLRDADVIVDALLGTGLDRPVEGEMAGWIEAINAAAAPVLAVDIPSGLHADSGRVLGCAVTADLTVSFIGLKVGLFTGEGRACSGRIAFADLDVPAAVYEGMTPAARRIDYAGLAACLAPRRASAHKGHFGHVLVVGGETGFAGAARMAAEAAARVGAGLVSVATRPQHAAVITAQRPELMVHGVDDASGLARLLQQASVVVIGPGLGQSDWAAGLLGAVLDSSLPLVIDADGLNLLAATPCQRDNWLLTPHPGEAARLLGSDTATVQSDRLAAVAQLQQRYGGTIVLKGSGSLVAGSGSRPPALCSDGNPGMASGGMGDVLSGVLGGLQAQYAGHVPDPAVIAELGVCLHAAAADAAATVGERGLLAADLLPLLRELANPDV